VREEIPSCLLTTLLLSRRGLSEVSGVAVEGEHLRLRFV